MYGLFLSFGELGKNTSAVFIFADLTSNDRNGYLCSDPVCENGTHSCAWSVLWCLRCDGQGWRVCWNLGSVTFLRGSIACLLICYSISSHHQWYVCSIYENIAVHIHIVVAFGGSDSVKGNTGPFWIGSGRFLVDYKIQ